MQQPEAERKGRPKLPNKLAIGASGEVAYILVLCGKVYGLGGSTKVGKKKKEENKLPSPWAMAYNPTLDVWESLPNPPHLAEGDLVENIFSACFPSPSSPCIVVGLPLDGVIQFFDVDTKIWREERFFCQVFSPNVLRGKAVAVGGNLLYWYALDNQCLLGYDVTTQTWFVGYVPMHDFSCYWGSEESQVDAPPSLAHLGDDMFCLFWISAIPSAHRISPDTYRIHCMKIQVTPPTSLRPSDRGIIPLEATILSCQSYIVKGKKAFCGGLVV